MDTQDAQERLMREFKLTDKQAKFCILVASGMKPLDAVKECYNLKHDKNYYGQLRELVKNNKIDSALKSIGRNLRDGMEKDAVAIIEAWREIAYEKETKTVKIDCKCEKCGHDNEIEYTYKTRINVKNTMDALDKLAQHNSYLAGMKVKTDDDMEEQGLEERIGEYLDENG